MYKVLFSFLLSISSINFAMGPAVCKTLTFGTVAATGTYLHTQGKLPSEEIWPVVGLLALNTAAGLITKRHIGLRRMTATFRAQKLRNKKGQFESGGPTQTINYPFLNTCGLFSSLVGAGVIAYDTEEGKKFIAGHSKEFLAKYYPALLPAHASVFNTSESPLQNMIGTKPPVNTKDNELEFVQVATQHKDGVEIPIYGWRPKKQQGQ